jgi:hypothetical protein
MSNFIPVDGFVPTRAQKVVADGLIARFWEADSSIERVHTQARYYEDFEWDESTDRYVQNLADERAALVEALAALGWERKDAYEAFNEEAAYYRMAEGE